MNLLPPLNSRVCIKIEAQEEEKVGYVSRLLSAGNYAVTLETNGVIIYSASFVLLNIRIRFLHPTIGTTARIRLPNRTDWIICTVKKLLRPSPRVQLEAEMKANAAAAPPIFETDTFSALKIAMEYIVDFPNDNGFNKCPPPIGTKVDIQILGDWHTGVISERQIDCHYVVEVPSIGRLFSQSFGLLEYKCRVKKPHIGAKAIVHLHSCDVTCSVAEHSSHPNAYILVAVSDDALQFDSRALAFLNIRISETEAAVLGDESCETTTKQEDVAPLLKQQQQHQQHTNSSSMASKRNREDSNYQESELGNELSDEDSGIEYKLRTRGTHTKQPRMGYFQCYSKTMRKVAPRRINNMPVKVNSVKQAPRERNLNANSVPEATDEESTAIRRVNLTNLPKAKAIAILVKREHASTEENEKLAKQHDKLKEEDLTNRIKKQFESIPKEEVKQPIDVACSDKEQAIVSGNYRIVIVENDGTNKKRFPHEQWMGILSSAICMIYDAKYMVFPDEFEPTVFMFYGVKQNARNAAHSFRTAFDFVHRLQIRYKFHRKRHGRKPVKQVRASYALGIVEALLKHAKCQDKPNGCNHSCSRRDNGEPSNFSKFHFGTMKHDLVESAYEDGFKDSAKIRL